MEANQHRETWNETAFIVLGKIEIRMVDATSTIDVDALDALIRQIDEQHPWIDFFLDGPPVPSIGILSKAVEFDSIATARKCYLVEVRPATHLHASKHYAYYRYVQNLAEMVARADIAHVYAVSSSICVEGRFNEFYPPTINRLALAAGSGDQAALSKLYEYANPVPPETSV